MQKYGYLTSSSPNSEALHTEESVIDAIMQMQLFGGLQQTGILDEETLKVGSKYEMIINKIVNLASGITQMWKQGYKQRRDN